MMTETPQQNPGPKSLPFGLRLQTAREALGLESKDAAAQLRLNEKIILMLEKDCYSSDLPVTFLRGYIRSYGKLLQIPESEIKQAIEPIQPKSSSQPMIANTVKEKPVTSGHYFMQLFTYLIILTLVSLVGVWWYTHSSTITTPTTETNLPLPKIEASTPSIALPVVNPAPVITPPPAPTQTAPAKPPVAKHQGVPVADLTEQDAEPQNSDPNNDTTD